MRLTVGLASLALLVAGGANATIGRGGLSGTVTRGPITPVCVVEQPCTAPAKHVTLVFVRNQQTVGRVVTDAEGDYRLRLSAGVYSVRRAAAGAFDRKLEPNRVRVYAGRSVQVDFFIDTGIR